MRVTCGGLISGGKIIHYCGVTAVWMHRILRGWVTPMQWMPSECPEGDSRKTGLSSWASRNEPPPPLAFLLLSWVVISFSLPCALVETFLRQAAAEFEKVSSSVSLAWHLEINGESFWVYKQTMDWMNDGAAYTNKSANIFVTGFVT